MGKHSFINEYLETYYDELTPKEFYRGIFPKGELAAHDEREIGKYMAIALELLPKADKKGNNARRYVLTDELDYLDKLQKKDNFIIISPISYAGKSRKAENARFIYALAIDLDGIDQLHNLIDLFHQIKNEVLPKPTYIVSSGSGLHLYYKFKKPLPCFNNIAKQLQALKQDLTKKIWNGYVTTLSKKPQLQSLFQGFRMVGGVTKEGSRTRAFEVGEAVDIEYLNSYCMYEKSKVTQYTYKSNLTLQKAAALYPEWYEKRILQNKPKGTWTCKEDLYYWWLNRLKAEITEGHRYYGILCLAVYAKKSGIEKKRLEQDAFGLLNEMEILTTTEDNHFTRQDILAALEMYNDSYITFPIDSISQLTALPIQKNKRNGRRQNIHLERARAVQNIDYPNGEWRNTKGKGKTKDKVVWEWQQQNPAGRKIDCIRDTKLSKGTVYRYWRE